MEDLSHKIWKYMDLAKFISILTNKALYFACPCEFVDPFEGYSIPKSCLQEFTDKSREAIDTIESISGNMPMLKELLTNNIEKLKTDNDSDINELLKQIERVKNKMDVMSENVNISLTKALEKSIYQSGVSCWHKSDYESEAMWKLYSASGQGIAIESTIWQLKASIKNEESLEIGSVTYISEDDSTNNYLKYDSIFYKRKSFEHEKELRAKISLEENGKGKFVKCDLDILITCVHVSPLVESYFKDIVENICAGNLKNINKPVIRSMLFDKPDFTVSGLARGLV